MSEQQSKIAFISANIDLTREWIRLTEQYGFKIDCFPTITPEIITKYKFMYLDITENLSLFRSLKKLKSSELDVIIYIYSEKTVYNNAFKKIYQSADQYLFLKYPFRKQQLEKHFALLEPLVGNMKTSETEGVLTYQIVAKLNEIFDSIVLGQPEPISYDFIKSRMLEILRNFLNYDYIFIGKHSGINLILNSVADSLQFDFPLEDVMSLDEFLQMLNYKTPILRNDISRKDRIYRTIFQKIDPDIRHMLIIPAKSLEGEDILWILLKKTPKMISSFDFYISHFMIKSFFVWYMFMQKTEIDLFRWDRYKSMKKDIALFRNIFDAFQFGLFLIDSTFTIRFANKKAAEILDKELEDLEGNPLAKAFSRESFELIEQNLKINQGEYRGEFEITLGKENRKSIGFSFYPKVTIEDQEFLLLIFKDITDLKLMEEENLRNDRLATLGIIASEIAHEIRNPLAGIRAIAETLKDEMEDHPTINEYTDRIIRQSERMEALIKNLFTYTKPPRPNLVLCNMKELLEEVQQLLMEKLKKKKIQFLLDVAPEATNIYADADQMQQVFLNIIQNSIDAIVDRGRIEINVFLAEYIPEKIRPLLQAWESDKIVKIIVKDNGGGIPPEAMNKLFLPFFTTKEEGVGLGLSIVYQIIKEHRGYIVYESTVGEGTECHIYLPQFKNHVRI